MKNKYQLTTEILTTPNKGSLLVAIFFSTCNLYAAPAQIFTPPNGFWIAPSDKGNSILYGPTDGAATWIVSQWGTPGNDLPPFSANTTATVNQRVTWNGSSWEVATSGHDLACDIEFDSFVSPNNGNKYLNAPTAGDGSNKSIAQMSRLRHKIALTHKYFLQYNTDCQNTSGNHITAIVLRNKTYNYTFFYQLRLKPLVGTEKYPNGNWSNKGTGNSWVFGDSILWYGLASPALGQRIFYDIDLLTRLKNLINFCDLRDTTGACSHYVFPDRDLNNWYVGGHYHGTHIWGHINATSIWDGFSLTEE